MEEGISKTTNKTIAKRKKVQLIPLTRLPQRAKERPKCTNKTILKRKRAPIGPS
jgi:hypothetical protein